MAEFASAHSYRQFEYTVKHKTRYFHDEQVRAFLNTVLETSQSRKESIKKFSVLFRAQRGYTWRKDNEGQPEEMEVPDAFPPARMKPLPEFVGDGRVNPKGIPCLYLASSLDTAIAEVRPWVGSNISLAQFLVMRDVVVVDCSRDKRRLPLWLVNGEPQEMPPEEREAVVWGDISYGLSRPVTPDEPVTEYVPTQVLAEAFRSHGYDGIVYRSLLAEGYNVALFDCDAAEVLNCGLYETRSVSFKSDQCSNPYFVTKYYEELKNHRTSELKPEVPEPPEPQ
ncbi:MAG: RES family NAD+ phosphorylase [Acidobacteriia bacterium]|nr:RES family NAD+ phosphorylase [Terriglobia bacterium]